MIHCVVHALSHRKGAYDETYEYIMNIITCLVLNRPYNVSKVIFDHLVDNVGAGSGKYIMYPRFIQMMIDDLAKDISKDTDDILGLRNMIADTISRLSKGPEPRVRRMICRIDNPAYVAPENDAWRHDNRPSKEPQSRLIDELVVNPADISQQGIDLTKVTFKQYIKITEESNAKDQSTSVQTEGVKGKEPEGVARDDSSDADDESTETEPEIDMATVGHGKVKLKKRPQKKKKGSDEEDTTYTTTAVEKKKLRIKSKAMQTSVIPRNVRARKGGALMSESQSGKSEKHVATSQGPEAEKVQKVEVPKEPEVQSVEILELEVTEVRIPTPPPENLKVPESSQHKNTVFPDPFEGFPNIRGELKDDFVLGEDFDMFHDASVKALEKKVSILEKEKAKPEADRDELKRQLEELKKVNEEIKSVTIKQAKKIKKMEDDIDDNAKMFELLFAETFDLHVKNVMLNDINKSLNQLISELHEASANEFKAMKLEMEAMKADKAMKDEQLTMLYTVMESHLGIDVHSVYNNIKIKKAEERRIERERRLAEEATQRKKEVIVETQDAGGSSSQADVEMVDAEVDPKGFVLVVQIAQRKKKSKELKVLLIRWKEEEIVEEEEEKEDEEIDFWMNEIDNYNPLNDKDDDEDQGSSGLLIVNPSVQQKIEDFMNDEINEQEEDHHQESSSLGKQHADQVFFT
ncbi:hypothetical protein Hdeb2414_s0004g00132761 [Helianthus debilis subsp. tardiflorus]